MNLRASIGRIRVFFYRVSLATDVGVAVDERSARDGFDLVVSADQKLRVRWSLRLLHGCRSRSSPRFSGSLLLAVNTTCMTRLLGDRNIVAIAEKLFLCKRITSQLFFTKENNSVLEIIPICMCRPNK